MAMVYVRNVDGVLDGYRSLDTLKAQLNGYSRNLAKLTASTLDDGTPVWTILHANPTDSSFVPGVAMFVGDLRVGKGKYYNTFIATRNLYTGNGEQYIFPPNFATSDMTVNPRDASNFTTPIQRLCTLPLKPTNFCPPDGMQRLAAGSGLGTYALMAGSYNGGSINGVGSVTPGSFDPAQSPSNYVGGNIVIGRIIYPATPAPAPAPSPGPTWAWGYILAGNGVDTTVSQSRIYGKINAQGFAATAPGALLGAMGLGGDTIIDMTRIPDSVKGWTLGTGEAGSEGIAVPGLAPANAAPLVAVAAALGNAGRGTMGTAKSVSVVAGVSSAPRYQSAASTQANSGAGASASSGRVTVSIVNASFK